MAKKYKEETEEVFQVEHPPEENFLPENTEVEVEEILASEDVELSGTELENFEAADIEEVEFVEEERLTSIIESILFATDRPVSVNSIRAVFKGTNIKSDKIRRALDRLAVEYAGVSQGVTLEEISGGYQLRTKLDNMEFLRRTLKSRSFKLSGPALEVLSIVAYKQPTIKSEIDEIRGVESGHLLRALMEKNLVHFEGKSELPGRPMQYGTTRKFLEIFGLRNLKELPTLSQIDEILPEGIGEEEAVKLSDVTGSLAEQIGSKYSEGEDELHKITEQLEDITTTSNFFEEEKKRQKQKKEEERAQDIRDALTMGEAVSTRDANWLRRFDEAQSLGAGLVEEPIVNADSAVSEAVEAAVAESSLFEEDAPHMDDELPFFEDAEDDKGEGEATV